jgi:hypothetical protein
VLWELSVVEQRYTAIQEVLGGMPVTEVGRRDLVGHLIAAQADGWHRLHLPTVRASAAGTRSGRHRVGADEVSDGLHDLGGLLQVRTVTSALNDPEARIGDPGRQLELMLRREHEVVTPGHH